MEVGPGQRRWEVRGVSSGGRRSRWGFQGSSPGLLWQQAVNIREWTTRAVMRVQENWYLEKGRSQECVRTGRINSLSLPDQSFF